jgi:hypothetical protein
VAPANFDGAGSDTGLRAASFDPHLGARPVLALRAARLFDGWSDRLAQRPLVLIKDGRVTAIESGDLDPPPDAEVVDLGEVTLLPGLIDTHVTSDSIRRRTGGSSARRFRRRVAAGDARECRDRPRGRDNHRPGSRRPGILGGGVARVVRGRTWERPGDRRRRSSVDLARRALPLHGRRGDRRRRYPSCRASVGGRRRRPHHDHGDRRSADPDHQPAGTPVTVAEVAAAVHEAHELAGR